jgi:hypothetical protein
LHPGPRNPIQFVVKKKNLDMSSTRAEDVNRSNPFDQPGMKVNAK